VWAASYASNTDKSTLSQLKQSQNASLLSDYIDFFKARLLYHDKKYEKALELLPAQQKSPVKKIEWERFWLRMNLLALLHQNAMLEPELQAIKKTNARNKSVIIKSEFFLGVAKLLIKQKTAALNHFSKILIDNPGSEYDQRIFNILETNNIPMASVLSKYQWNQRAVKLTDTGFAHKATLIWKDILKDDEKVAYSTFKEKKYREAAKLYENLLHSKNHQASEIEILMTLAKAQARSDDFDGAIKTNNLIKSKYAHTRASVDADFKLGFLYFDSKQYEKAVSYLEKFLKNGSPYQKEQARW
jgi:tetratricopeptide (TPR) repeat protein